MNTVNSKATNQVTWCHMVGQNEYGVVQRGSNTNQNTPLRLGTIGCGVCVGVALWRASDGKAVLAHIEPELDQLDKVREAVAKIHELLPDPSKVEIATAGKDRSTQDIIHILKSKFNMLVEEHIGSDEISINASTGEVRSGCSGHRPTQKPRPDDLIIKPFATEDQNSRRSETSTPSSSA